jgi:hypothetical protein
MNAAPFSTTCRVLLTVGTCGAACICAVVVAHHPGRMVGVSDRRSIRYTLHVLARARVAHCNEREQANNEQAAQEDHAERDIN